MSNCQHGMLCLVLAAQILAIQYKYCCIFDLQSVYKYCIFRNCFQSIGWTNRRQTTPAAHLVCAIVIVIVIGRVRLFSSALPQPTNVSRWLKLGCRLWGLMRNAKGIRSKSPSTCQTHQQSWRKAQKDTHQNTHTHETKKLNTLITPERRRL